MTQRLSDRRETPLCDRPTVLPRNPLGQPARARARRTAGRTFCDPRTSCGDTNGSTLHVAKHVRGIQNPQSCRQAHRKSHLSGAPFFSMAYPKSYLARFPIGHTVVTQRFELVDIWDKALGLYQPDIVRWKLNFGSVCFGRRQSPSRISCKSQRFLASIFSSDSRSASS